MGIPLADVIFDIGGGLMGGKHFKAVQTGGPSGGCLPASHLHLPVDYESLAEAGSIMGSGGMVVVDEDTCMVDLARFFLSFTQVESCGKCVPCRVGTRQMLNILENICQGKGQPGDIERLEQLAQLIKSTALCGLGQTAPNPVLTTLRYFREEAKQVARRWGPPTAIEPVIDGKSILRAVQTVPSGEPIERLALVAHGGTRWWRHPRVGVRLGKGAWPRSISLGHVLSCR